MANTIKQKRGTTDPGASDLVVGELAINTTDGGVFTKTDGGTVVEVGASSGVTNNADDTDSIGLGTNALDSESAGLFHLSQNTALGVSAATRINTGGPNVAIGYKALFDATNSGHNVAVGWESLYSSNADSNTAVGSRALYFTSSGDKNVAVGRKAGHNNTTGAKCTFLGFEAGQSNTTGINNTLIGSRAGQAITTFGGVVAVGQDAASEQSHHNSSTFVGRDCGRNTKGNRNTAVGQGAQRGGGSNQCDENVSVGYHTLYNIGGGDNNTAVGSEAGKNVSTASSVTCIGRNAGKNITTGNDSICIGKDAGSNITTGANLIVVGTGAQPSSATATQEITLGSSSISSLRIPGLQSGASDGDVLTYNSTNDDLELSTPAGIPAGTIIHTVLSTAPTGYLKANGAAVSRTTYATLFAAIGTTFGSGDGSTTFNLPDLRGEFLRAWDDGRGVDSGRSINTAQSAAFASHNHTATDSGHAHTYRYPAYRTLDQGGSHGAYTYPSPLTTSTYTGYANITVGNTGGTETRPRNISVLVCIKY